MADIGELIKDTKEARVRVDRGFKYENQVVERRLKGEGKIITDKNAGYLDILPEFQGQSFVDVIEEVIKEKGHASYLDIGCGAGLALLDLREKFSPDVLRIVGIGNESAINTHLFAPDREIFYREPTKSDLEKGEIEHRHINFLDADKVFGSNAFDVITSVYGLTWIEYPRYNLVKRVWRLLKPSGRAFIVPFGLLLKSIVNGSIHERSAFAYLRDTFKLPFYERNEGVCFEKTKDLLPNVLVQDILGGAYGGVKLKE